jgi:hypothetical protein
MNPKNQARAVRYRQLALAEPDKTRATLLLAIADEAERDVLCTVDSTNLGYARQNEQRLPTQSQKLPIQTYTGH